MYASIFTNISFIYWFNISLSLSTVNLFLIFNKVYHYLPFLYAYHLSFHLLSLFLVFMLYTFLYLIYFNLPFILSFLTVLYVFIIRNPLHREDLVKSQDIYDMFVYPYLPHYYHYLPSCLTSYSVIRSFISWIYLVFPYLLVTTLCLLTTVGPYLFYSYLSFTIGL